MCRSYRLPFSIVTMEQCGAVWTRAVSILYPYPILSFPYMGTKISQVRGNERAMGYPTACGLPDTHLALIEFSGYVSSFKKSAASIDKDFVRYVRDN